MERPVKGIFQQGHWPIFHLIFDIEAKIWSTLTFKRDTQNSYFQVDV